jgi:hypothetical protein
VDMLAGDVLSLADDGAIDRRHVGRIAAALRPRAEGGAVIGVERGFALEDAGGPLTYLDELWTDHGLRMNEGGCDPDGRFYCGSMAYDQRPRRRPAGRLAVPGGRLRGCGSADSRVRRVSDPGPFDGPGGTRTGHWRRATPRPTRRCARTASRRARSPQRSH